MRTVKDPTVRKNEILTVARKFFFQKGYEQTTIQDIINELGIAKGTFYHYFKSKLDLLDELTDQMTTEIATQLHPILKSKKDAIEKFNEIFARGAAFKAANIELFLVFLNVLYKDENTIIREKMFRRSIEKNGPIIAQIVKQGIEEGVFNTQYPDHIGEMAIQIGRGFNEMISSLLLKQSLPVEQLIDITRERIDLYQDTLERILGAPPGSVKIYDPEKFERLIKEFYDRIKQSRKRGNDV